MLYYLFQQYIYFSRTEKKAREKKTEEKVLYKLTHLMIFFVDLLK